MKRIAIFASGAGSNAAKIISYFKGHPAINIALIVCNKPGAGVINIAANNNLPVIMITKEKFFSNKSYLEELREKSINYIVLAGFLWKIPTPLISAYDGKIINIHPALLPKYGGKGMYGQFVHEAVIAAKDAESGITIHVVDELYDHGKKIFQAICPVLPGDNALTLSERIHTLEHKYYPEIIETFILNNSE